MKLNKSIYALEKKEKEKIVVSTIYKANQKDSDGQWMSSATIAKMRESFHDRLSQGQAGVITLHKGITGTAYPLSTWLEPNGDWKGEFKIKDDATYSLIRKGILTGVSIEGVSYLDEDEIIDPLINKIAIVEKASNGESFEVIKEEKSMIQKTSDFFHNLLKGDNMSTSSMEDRVKNIENTLKSLKTSIEAIGKPEVEKEDKQAENKLVTLEKEVKDLSEMVEALTSGVSQTTTTQVSANVSTDENWEDLWEHK